MAFDGFIKIEGIDGDSTDENHKNWIEIQSYSHGLHQQVGGSRSSGGAATAGRVDHNDFSFMKEIDKATPLLTLHCCNGKHIPKVEVELCRAGDKKNVFMKWTLEDVIVASVQTDGASGSAMPSESVSLNYGKVLWTYTNTDPKKGTTGGKVESSWDTKTNKGG